MCVLMCCKPPRVCSGSVLQGSRLQKDCDQNDDGIADDGAAAAITTDANHYLWSCEFCDVECSGRETEPGFTGHVLLTDVSKSGADAVKVGVDVVGFTRQKQSVQHHLSPGSRVKQRNCLRYMLSQPHHVTHTLYQLAMTGP